MDVWVPPWLDPLLHMGRLLGTIKPEGTARRTLSKVQRLLCMPMHIIY